MDSTQKPAKLNHYNRTNNILLSRINLKFLFGAMLIVTLSACSSSGSEPASDSENNDNSEQNNSSGDSNNTDNSALAGTWDKCDDGRRTTYVFTTERWSQYLARFTSSDCSGEPFRAEGLQDPDEVFFAGSYSIVGNATSDGGLSIQQINMTSDTFEGSAVISSSQVTQYNIVYTGTSNQLVFGEFNQRAEADRPTQLNFNEPFVSR